MSDLDLALRDQRRLNAAMLVSKAILLAMGTAWLVIYLTRG
jgi:hypothetical protein